MYCEPDARPGLYILPVGAFADPNFPALSAMHTWMQLQEGVKRFQSAITAGS